MLESNLIRLQHLVNIRMQQLVNNIKKYNYTCNMCLFSIESLYLQAILNCIDVVAKYL